MLLVGLITFRSVPGGQKADMRKFLEQSPLFLVADTGKSAPRDFYSKMPGGLGAKAGFPPSVRQREATPRVRFAAEPRSVLGRRVLA
eukprot:3621639-Pyramimonas_sp.AAC.1